MESVMKKKTKIILVLLIIVGAVLIFFLSKNPLAKSVYDMARNTKAWMEVKLSNEYQQMDSEKEYYKDEKNIRIPILIYHEITTKEPSRDLFYMQTTAKRFEEQIKGLLEEGYHIISYDDLVEYNKGNKALTEKTLLIGFDDGWVGNYENAFPILQKYQVPAAIYVVDDLVGTPGYFTWEQAKTMSDSGLVSIYSHGRTHIFYDKESNETLVADVKKAYENIEKHTGKRKNKVFTYPYGAYREEQIEVLAKEGYIQNATDDEINQSSALDLKCLHRFYVKQNESAYKIIKNINRINLPK